MFALSELVDSDDSGARPAIGLAAAACHGRLSRRNVWGRMLLQGRGVVDQVQVQLAGDRGRMHRTNGSSSLLEKVDSLLCCPPSPQPASLEVLKGGFFVPADQSSLVHLGEASGKQALAASKTKRRKTSSAHTELATMETEMRNLTLKRNRLLTTECRIKG